MYVYVSSWTLCSPPILVILIVQFLKEKKEEIWLSPVTKTPTPTEQSKKQRDNIKTPPKTLITQLLRTDLGRSVGVTAVTQLVWLNQFMSAQPSHSPQKLFNQSYMAR